MTSVYRCDRYIGGWIQIDKIIITKPIIDELSNYNIEYSGFNIGRHNTFPLTRTDTVLDVINKNIKLPPVILKKSRKSISHNRWTS